jgi:RHS repeat-associated protein
VAVFMPDAANPGGAPIAYFIHADHIDTPRVVVDRSNSVRWRWLAEPFGATAAETNPSGLGAFAFNLRFPGQYLDQESGLHYNYFRDYDASVGRYVQSDPVGLAGGINTYAYVEGDPLSGIDPQGLMGRGIPNYSGPSTSALSQKAMGCLCKLDSRFCMSKTAISAAPPDWLDHLFGVLPAGQTNVFGQITINSELFSPSRLADRDRLFDLFWALAHEAQHRMQSPWQRWYTQAIDSAAHDAIDNAAYQFVTQHKSELMQCFRDGCNQ